MICAVDAGRQEIIFILIGITFSLLSYLIGYRYPPAAFSSDPKFLRSEWFTVFLLSFCVDDDTCILLKRWRAIAEEVVFSVSRLP